MRRLLPLALLIAACGKPPENPAPAVEAASSKIVTTDLTPTGMSKAMDVPLYPGSSAPDGLSNAPVKREDGSIHYSLVLATNDSVDQAKGWYAKVLGSPALGPSIVAKTKKGNDVIVRIASEAGRTLIRITSIAYPESSPTRAVP